MLPLVRGCNPLFTKFIELCSWRAMYSPGNDFSFVGHRTSLKRQLKLHVRFAGAHQTAILRAEISFHPWKHASLVAHTITKKKISRRERGGGSRGRKKTVSCKSRVEYFWRVFAYENTYFSQSYELNLYFYLEKNCFYNYSVFTWQEWPASSVVYSEVT